MDQKKNRWTLPWPWNIVVSAIVVVGLGWCIGYLWSFLLVMGFWAIQRKRNPGMPAGGYCMARTRSRLKWLPLGALFTLLGIGTLWVVWYDNQHQMGMERSEVIGFLVVGLLMLAFGLFTCYISIQDSFFPEKSTLAETIRSQLPYPEEAPPVAELFAMVDKDLQENGQTFGPVTIGKEWVLGDMASYIPRIRAVFGRDEIVHRQRGERTITTRQVELHIVDDRNQQHFTDVKNPRELPMILDCLRLRAPDAYFGDYKEMAAYCSVSEEEQQQREREFRRRQAEKQQMDFQNPPSPEQKVILMAAQVSPTSQVDEKALYAILNSETREKGLALVAGKPVTWNDIPFGTLWYEPMKAGGWLMLEEQIPGGATSGSRKALRRWAEDDRDAVRVLLDWANGEIDQPEIWKMGRLEGGTTIDLNHLAEPQKIQETRPAELVLVTMEGAGQTHNNFTREDIQVAADGIVDRTYQMVRYTKAGGWLLMTVESGTKTDGRCTVTVSQPVKETLHFFRIKCSYRQAAEYLLAFYENRFSPDWREWKDVTRKVTR